MVMANVGIMNMNAEYPIERDQPVKSEEINALRASVGWDHDNESYDTILKRTYTHYTVRSQGKLIGFLNVLSDGIGDAFLVDIMVHPEFQRNGIGTTMVEQAVRDLSADGVQCIQVTFNPDEEPFYKKIGFHIFKAGIIDNKTMKVNL